MWILLLLFVTSSHSMETYICTGSVSTYNCHLYNGHEREYLEDVIHVHEAESSDSYGNSQPYSEPEPEEDIDDWVDRYILNKDN